MPFSILGNCQLLQAIGELWMFGQVLDLLGLAEIRSGSWRLRENFTGGGTAC